jgi:alkylation response protein AidB-like acyl-CoA dehydrogenase
MNFDLSEEQRLLTDSVRRYLERDYTFEARKKVVAADSGYSTQAWTTFAELGLLALPISTEHGGFGGTALDLMPVMEAFGEALVVEPYLSTVICARMIERAGPGDASRQILPAVAEGAMKLALAQSEDGARYDLNHVAMVARPSGEGFVLDGLKRAVVHAPQADRLLVSARTSGAITDAEGISLFVVDPKAAGIGMRAYRTIDELRGADVEFRGVKVGADALVGQRDRGFALLDEGVDAGNALLCAEAVGVLKRANDATLDYLKTRKQFGVAIGSFQALQHRMVDMVIHAEQARSMASIACAAVTASGTPHARSLAVSAARVRVADACRHVSQEAVQLHGGMGMTEELAVSHAFRRLTTLRHAMGDVDFHLERLARG